MIMYITSKSITEIIELIHKVLVALRTVWTGVLYLEEISTKYQWFLNKIVGITFYHLEFNLS